MDCGSYLISVNKLKDYIVEVIKASPEYMQKEKVREALQNIIVNMVKNGVISTDDDLTDFFNTSDMALKALKMVPLGAYKKLSNK